MTLRYACAHTGDWVRSYACLRVKSVRRSRFVVLVAAYNNAAWYRRVLNSIFRQRYSDYRVLYIDDASTDGSLELVWQYVRACHQESRVEVIRNQQNVGATANRFFGSRVCADDEIVVVLDGDDWFAHPFVLDVLARAYDVPAVWLTYGQFRRWPSGMLGQCRQLPPEYDYRAMSDWYTSHLRTYRAWLFKHMHEEDAKIDGKFFDVAGDVAEMLPLLELARGHTQFISQVLYVYNCANPTSDFICKRERQVALFRLIQQRPARTALDFKS